MTKSFDFKVFAIGAITNVSIAAPSEDMAFIELYNLIVRTGNEQNYLRASLLNGDYLQKETPSTSEGAVGNRG